jgi:ribosome-binding protein aMBF1 (putative translation factor)
MKLSELASHAEIAAEQRADPEFRADWDRSALARAVAQRVVAYRVEHGLTQTALARRLGTHQPAVARLESGDHTPSLDTLWRLAARLGLESHIDVTAHGIAI